MPQSQPEKISQLLDSLTCELIGLCLDTLADGGQLWPTVAYAAKGGGLSFLTFDDDAQEKCLQEAHRAVKQLGREAEAYAIAYDGFVQLGKGPATSDALLVEFGERGMRCAYSAYVCYRKGATPEEFEATEPMPAGEEKLLLA